MVALYILIGINIGVFLTLILQGTLIAILVYCDRPREVILSGVRSMAEEARRRIRGKAVMIPPSSPIQEQVHQMMQTRTLPEDV